MTFEVGQPVVLLEDLPGLRLDRRDEYLRLGHLGRVEALVGSKYRTRFEIEPGLSVTVDLYGRSLDPDVIAGIVIAVMAAHQIAEGYEGAWVLMALAGIYVGFALANALRD